MKTAEEILGNVSGIYEGDQHLCCYEVDIVLKAMQAYHAAQLEAGIKAKALKKKGTDKWYYFYPADELFYESCYPDLFSNVDEVQLPNDAEIVNIIILEDK